MRQVVVVVVVLFFGAKYRVDHELDVMEGVLCLFQCGRDVFLFSHRHCSVCCILAVVQLG